jgi:hypothetical protein
MLRMILVASLSWSGMLRGCYDPETSVTVYTAAHHYVHRTWTFASTTVGTWDLSEFL